MNVQYNDIKLYYVVKIKQSKFTDFKLIRNNKMSIFYLNKLIGTDDFMIYDTIILPENK